MGTASTMAVMTFGTTLLGGVIGKMTSKGINATGDNFGTKFSARSAIAPRQDNLWRMLELVELLYTWKHQVLIIIYYMLVVAIAGHEIEELTKRKTK